MSATGRHHIVEENPWRTYDITVDSLTDRNAATASVRFHTANRFNPHITATGSSKREPEDRINEYVGEQLAIGRALVSLGQHLIDAAYPDDPDA